MELNDPAVLICKGEMLVGQKVVNADLVIGDVRGCKLQVDLESLEAGVLENLSFKLLCALGGVAYVKGGKAVLLRLLGNVAVVHLKINGDNRLSVKNGDDLFVRKQKAVRLVEILNGVVRRHHIRPCTAPVVAFRPFDKVGIEPYVGVAVYKGVRQKIRKFFSVKLKVIGLDVKQAHLI